MTTIAVSNFYPCHIPVGSFSASTADNRVPGASDEDDILPASSIHARAASELSRIFRECRQADWDGYSATPISRATCHRALFFLHMLPSWLPAPEITPETDGELDIEWYASPDRAFSISIGNSGPVTYAGLFGENEEVHGVTNFHDCVPKNLLQAISDVFQKKQTGRAA